MFTKNHTKKPASQPVIKLVSFAQRVFPSLNFVTTDSTTKRIIIQFRNGLKDFLCSLLYNYDALETRAHINILRFFRGNSISTKL